MFTLHNRMRLRADISACANVLTLCCKGEDQKPRALYRRWPCVEELFVGRAVCVLQAAMS